MGEWDEGFDELQGIVTLEVQVATRATSGRPKHTDPEEQGAWVAQLTEMDWRLRQEKDPADDAKVGSVNMVGFRPERWTDWD
jgi:hypothetical protein